MWLIRRQLQHRLNERGLRCFELGEVGRALREAVRENAQALAKKAGLEIEHLLCKGARKKTGLGRWLAKRGDHAGLVHIFSAMESAAVQAVAGLRSRAHGSACHARACCTITST